MLPCQSIGVSTMEVFINEAYDEEEHVLNSPLRTGTVRRGVKGNLSNASQSSAAGVVNAEAFSLKSLQNGVARDTSPSSTGSTQGEADQYRMQQLIYGLVDDAVKVASAVQDQSSDGASVPRAAVPADLPSLRVQDSAEDPFIGSRLRRKSQQQLLKLNAKSLPSSGVESPDAKPGTAQDLDSCEGDTPRPTVTCNGGEREANDCGAAHTAGASRSAVQDQHAIGNSPASVEEISAVMVGGDGGGAYGTKIQAVTAGVDAAGQNEPLSVYSSMPAIMRLSRAHKDVVSSSKVGPRTRQPTSSSRAAPPAFLPQSALPLFADVSNHTSSSPSRERECITLKAISMSSPSMQGAGPASPRSLLGHSAENAGLVCSPRHLQCYPTPGASTSEGLKALSSVQLIRGSLSPSSDATLVGTSEFVSPKSEHTSAACDSLFRAWRGPSNSLESCRTPFVSSERFSATPDSKENSSELTSLESPLGGTTSIFTPVMTPLRTQNLAPSFSDPYLPSPLTRPSSNSYITQVSTHFVSVGTPFSDVTTSSSSPQLPADETMDQNTPASRAEEYDDHRGRTPQSQYFSMGTPGSDVTSSYPEFPADQVADLNTPASGPAEYDEHYGRTPQTPCSASTDGQAWDRSDTPTAFTPSTGSVSPPTPFLELSGFSLISPGDSQLFGCQSNSRVSSFGLLLGRRSAPELTVSTSIEQPWDVDKHQTQDQVYVGAPRQPNGTAQCQNAIFESTSSSCTKKCSGSFRQEQTAQCAAAESAEARKQVNSESTCTSKQELQTLSGAAVVPCRGADEAAAGFWEHDAARQTPAKGSITVLDSVSSFSSAVTHAEGTDPSHVRKPAGQVQHSWQELHSDHSGPDCTPRAQGCRRDRQDEGEQPARLQTSATDITTAAETSSSVVQAANTRASNGTSASSLHLDPHSHTEGAEEERASADEAGPGAAKSVKASAGHLQQGAHRVVDDGLAGSTQCSSVKSSWDLAGGDRSGCHVASDGYLASCSSQGTYATKAGTGWHAVPSQPSSRGSNIAASADMQGSQTVEAMEASSDSSIKQSMAAGLFGELECCQEEGSRSSPSSIAASSTAVSIVVGCSPSPVTPYTQLGSEPSDSQLDGVLSTQEGDDSESDAERGGKPGGGSVRPPPPTPTCKPGSKGLESHPVSSPMPGATPDVMHKRHVSDGAVGLGAPHLMREQPNVPYHTGNAAEVAELSAALSQMQQQMVELAQSVSSLVTNNVLTMMQMEQSLQQAFLEQVTSLRMSTRAALEEAHHQMAFMRQEQALQRATNEHLYQTIEQLRLELGLARLSAVTGYSYGLSPAPSEQEGTSALPTPHEQWLHQRAITPRSGVSGMVPNMVGMSPVLTSPGAAGVLRSEEGRPSTGGSQAHVNGSCGGQRIAPQQDHDKRREHEMLSDSVATTSGHAGYEVRACGGMSSYSAQSEGGVGSDGPSRWTLEGSAAAAKTPLNPQPYVGLDSTPNNYVLSPQPGRTMVGGAGTSAQIPQVKAGPLGVPPTLLGGVGVSAAGVHGLSHPSIHSNLPPPHANSTPLLSPGCRPLHSAAAASPSGSIGPWKSSDPSHMVTHDAPGSAYKPRDVDAEWHAIRSNSDCAELSSLTSFDESKRYNPTAAAAQSASPAHQRADPISHSHSTAGADATNNPYMRRHPRAGLTECDILSMGSNTNAATGSHGERPGLLQRSHSRRTSTTSLEGNSYLPTAINPPVANNLPAPTSGFGLAHMAPTGLPVRPTLYCPPAVGFYGSGWQSDAGYAFRSFGPLTPWSSFYPNSHNSADPVHPYSSTLGMNAGGHGLQDVLPPRRPEQHANEPPVPPVLPTQMNYPLLSPIPDSWQILAYHPSPSQLTPDVNSLSSARSAHSSLPTESQSALSPQQPSHGGYQQHMPVPAANQAPHLPHPFSTHSAGMQPAGSVHAAAQSRTIGTAGAVIVASDPMSADLAKVAAGNIGGQHGPVNAESASLTSSSLGVTAPPASSSSGCRPSTTTLTMAQAQVPGAARSEVSACMGQECTSSSTADEAASTAALTVADALHSEAFTVTTHDDVSSPEGSYQAVPSDTCAPDSTVSLVICMKRATPRSAAPASAGYTSNGQASAAMTTGAKRTIEVGSAFSPSGATGSTPPQKKHAIAVAGSTRRSVVQRALHAVPVPVGVSEGVNGEQHMRVHSGGSVDDMFGAPLQSPGAGLYGTMLPLPPQKSGSMASNSLTLLADSVAAMNQACHTDAACLGPDSPKEDLREVTRTVTDNSDEVQMDMTGSGEAGNSEGPQGSLPDGSAAAGVDELKLGEAGNCTVIKGEEGEIAVVLEGASEVLSAPAGLKGVKEVGDASDAVMNGVNAVEDVAQVCAVLHKRPSGMVKQLSIAIQAQIDALQESLNALPERPGSFGRRLGKCASKPRTTGADVGSRDGTVKVPSLPEQQHGVDVNAGHQRADTNVAAIEVSSGHDTPAAQEQGNGHMAAAKQNSDSSMANMQHHDDGEEVITQQACNPGMAAVAKVCDDEMVAAQQQVDGKVAATQRWQTPWHDQQADTMAEHAQDASQGESHADGTLGQTAVEENAPSAEKYVDGMVEQAADEEDISPAANHMDGLVGQIAHEEDVSSSEKHVGVNGRLLISVSALQVHGPKSHPVLQHSSPASGVNTPASGIATPDG